MNNDLSVFFQLLKKLRHKLKILLQRKIANYFQKLNLLEILKNN